jgi:hypothetical protein
MKSHVYGTAVDSVYYLVLDDVELWLLIATAFL